MYALGIDLGTTWTAAAVWSRGAARTVALGTHAHAVPSVVLVAEDGTTVCGEAAQLAAASAPARAVREFKRRFGDEVGYRVGGREWRADALTAALLADVVARVTAAEGGQPDALALTVPATWQGYRRELLVEVARRVVPDVPVAIVAEPAAAAIHHAARRQQSPGAVLGVYDLGGGTFDATVLAKTASGFELLGTPVGSDTLGGCDVDQLLLRRVLAGVPGAAETARSGDPDARAAMAALRDAVVTAKEALSSATSTVVPVTFGGVVTEVTLTREDLEAEVGGLVDATLDVFADAVAACELEPSALDGVLMIGGASRMPVVAAALRERFGVEPVLDEHPKFAVCLGAAISAGAVAGRRPSRPSVAAPRVVAPAPAPAVPETAPAPVAAEPAPAPAVPEPAPARLRLPWDPEPEPIPAAAEVPAAPALPAPSVPADPAPAATRPAPPTPAPSAAPTAAADVAAAPAVLRLPWDPEPEPEDDPYAWSPQAALSEAPTVELPPVVDAGVGYAPAPEDGDEPEALPELSPGLAVAVDLAVAGLEAADEVPLRPVAELRRRPSMRPVQSVEFELGAEDGYRRQGVTTAVLVIVGVVVLLGLVVALTTILG
ncbi:MAG: Hsp70 family protein [Kineosporiaceae bacterium]